MLWRRSAITASVAVLSALGAGCARPDARAATAASTIRVRCLAADGGPAAGASLWVHEPETPTAEFLRQWRTGAPAATVPDPTGPAAATTDERGEALVPWRHALAGTVTITAARGDERGRLAVWTDEPAGSSHELVLAATRSLRVHVRHDDGTPAAGLQVDVATAFVDAGRDAPPRPIAASRTDDGGDVRFAAIDDWALPLAAGGSDGRFVVTVRLPGYPIASEHDLATAADAPIDVQLPPTGFVRVALRDLDGAVTAALRTIEVSVADRADYTHHDRTPPSTRIEVPLGMRWNVGAAGFGFADVDGPEQPGAAVDVLVRHRDDAMHVAGRLRAPSRPPRALRIADGDGHALPSTDDDGAFRLFVPARAGTTTFDGELRWHDDVDGRLFTVPLHVPMAPGRVLDLGELLLQPAEPQLPLLVAGTVRSGDGLGDVLLTVVPFERTGSGAFAALGRPRYRPHADGTFAIHGEPLDGAIALHVSWADGAVELRPIRAGERVLDLRH